MINSTAISLFLGVWASLFLIDSYLRQRFPVVYDSALENRGIQFGICQVRWATTSANRMIFKLGQLKPRLLTLWFNAGVLFSLFTMPASVFILAHSLLQHLPHSTSPSSVPWSASTGSTRAAPAPSSPPILTPVMPGVNLPLSQFSYYLITLLFCGILHEMGHAVAAVRENVRLYECGVFVFALYPGAYVKLNSEQISTIKPLSQLRIFCAGIWHNFIMVMSAVFVLICLPQLLSIAFDIKGRGVVVTDVVEGSAVSGPMGLKVGDVVTSLEDCSIYNTRDWLNCIKESMDEHYKVQGHCISIDTLTSPDAVGSIYRNGSAQVYFDDFGVTQCCSSNVTNSHICFSYKVKSNQRYSCLSARKTTLNPRCHKHSDCQGHPVALDGQRRARGPYHMYCVLPAVGNLTRLLRVKRRRTSFSGHAPVSAPSSSSSSSFIAPLATKSTLDALSSDLNDNNHRNDDVREVEGENNKEVRGHHSDDNDVLFFGYPLDMYYSVTLSDYVPRFHYIPYNLPYVIATYCKYVISLSGALALLNVVPCYELDGQYILKAAMDYLLKDRCPSGLLNTIYKFIMASCTLLLMLNLILALKTLVIS